MALLDLRAFPNEDPRAGELLRALMYTYGLPQPARQVVARAGIAEAEIAWQGAMLDVWPDIVEKAAATGRLRRLVEVVAEDPNSRAASPVFAYLLAEQRISQPAEQTTDPFGHGLINDRQRAFFDRTSLRSRLREMVLDRGHRVLTVEGGPRTGRTFTWFLIHHVLASQGIHPCRIRMSEYTEPVRVAELTGFLNDEFREWSVQIDHHSSEDQQADRLVSQLRGRMREERRSVPAQPRHWLVFDDSESVRFTEPALRAVVRLVQAVVEEEMADRLRIVLLAYDGWLPPDVEGYTAREQLGPIGIEDLHDFFRTVAAEAGRPIDADTARGLAAKVLSETGHDGCLPDGPLPLTTAIQHTAAGLGRSLYQGC
ncbi:effector-associated domain EAD1-containing protein [Kitasatospora sp. NPDC056800]|uniref:effector-associated domain EAD1-containing protein n=1 Tax=Kitasatospora sp. NPDC056800 TaxID=3345948 RepID=UPI0036AB41F1